MHIGTKITILVGSVAAMLLIAAGIIMTIGILSRFGERGVEVTADAEQLGPQWKEIDPPQPLEIEKDVPLLAIEVIPPFDGWKAKGIVLPTGEVVNPEITLVSSQGTEYHMAHYGATRAGLMNDRVFAQYGFDETPPRSTKIERILIRCDATIPVKQIRWEGFDWKDRK